jgi:hypothetical protein
MMAILGYLRTLSHDNDGDDNDASDYNNNNNKLEP